MKHQKECAEISLKHLLFQQNLHKTLKEKGAINVPGTARISLPLGYKNGAADKRPQNEKIS